MLWPGPQVRGLLLATDITEPRWPRLLKHGPGGEQEQTRVSQHITLAPEGMYLSIFASIYDISMPSSWISYSNIIH